MMHSYWWDKATDERHFVVGYVDSAGTRTPMHRFELERDALTLVNYLNGGDGDRSPMWLTMRMRIET